MENLRARFLELVWDFFGETNRRCISDADRAAIKETFDHIRNGRSDEAAKAASKNAYAQEIWTKAVE